MATVRGWGERDRKREREGGAGIGRDRRSCAYLVRMRVPPPRKTAVTIRRGFVFVDHLLQFGAPPYRKSQREAPPSSGMPPLYTTSLVL